MKKNVHYSEELKWEAVRIRQQGASYSHPKKELGIKNKAQIQTWMRYGKDIGEGLSEFNN